MPLPNALTEPTSIFVMIFMSRVQSVRGTLDHETTETHRHLNTSERTVLHLFHKLSLAPESPHNPIRTQSAFKVVDKLTLKSGTCSAWGKLSEGRTTAVVPDVSTKK